MCERMNADYFPNFGYSLRAELGRAQVTLRSEGALRADEAQGRSKKRGNMPS
jgi:hypothetical protein